MTGPIARRRLLRLGAAVPAALLFDSAAGTLPAAAHSTGSFPTDFSLPDGFRPEGIAIGSAPFAYFGSLGTGDIYRASLRTGEGKIISKGPGTPSVGLELDRSGRLFVSGGAAGNARVVDVHSGKILASYQFAAAGQPTFVNDVVLRQGIAWFTDSFQPVLYGLPLGHHNRLPGQDKVVRLPLSGEWQQTEDFNANGIAPTPDGRGLLIPQDSTGGLFRVDPRTGAARRVDLGTLQVSFGDGLLLEGDILYVCQQQLNAIDVVRLNRAGTRGKPLLRITDPRFDIPTTVASFGNRLYFPNARFNTTPEPTTTYTAVAVKKPRV